MAADKSGQQTRSKSQIQADLAATRERLTASVETLIDEVHPNRIKQRQIASAKKFAKAELASAKAQVVDEDGELRKDRIAIAAGALAGLVTFVLIVKRVKNNNR